MRGALGVEEGGPAGEGTSRRLGLPEDRSSKRLFCPCRGETGVPSFPGSFIPHPVLGWPGALALAVGTELCPGWSTGEGFEVGPPTGEILTGGVRGSREADGEDLACLNTGFIFQDGAKRSFCHPPAFILA